ncbi:MAG: portal protein [Kiritimatiellia bacterium]
MDSRVKELIKQAEYLFGKKDPIMSLWQEIAEQFYPERADFTTNRSLGEEFAAHLMSSVPLMIRRSLGESISGMLRPNGKDWFHIGTRRDDRVDTPGKQWLESKEKVMRRAMYDPAAQFVRATKEGDHDFATFGQCAISTELTPDRSTLLYKCWHLRDMAWCENDMLVTDVIIRKWPAKARALVARFPDKVHPRVKECMAREPYKKINCYHIVMPSDQYQTGTATDDNGEARKKWPQPYVSIYVDMDNQTILYEGGSWTTIYSIPRWQTVSGSQYAHSPAVVVGLPEARAIQAMNLTLIEAGEKAVNPPMIATQDVVRGDISIFAGGVTWVDQEYDERLGESIRPIPQDYSGLPLGVDMLRDKERLLMEAFYLNKLNMPPVEAGRDMTAYEVGQRVQEYVRNALPLFEPMEVNYNGEVCNQTFELMLRAGAFGSAYDMPQSLRGQDIEFRFESPLHEAEDRQKGHSFLEARSMLMAAAEMDPDADTILDIKKALRNSLEGMRTPADWMRSEQEAEGLAAQRAEGRAQAQAAAEAEQMGRVAKEVGGAVKNMQGMEGL